MPMWACWRWGLPCHDGRPSRGALLPHHFTLTCTAKRPSAVCFLWHFPSDRSGSALPTTVPCPVRTFLTSRRTEITILRYTALQDVGKAVHPSYVEGQIQGGAVQGIGWALNEEYFYNTDSQMANSSFLDYRMPTSLDLPMIDTVLVEVANPGHPFGVRGVGEVCIVPPIAAIANAIYAAVGVRMCELPMSPGNVLKALWAKK